MSEALTEKQKAFADFLLTDPEQNQTKAYQYAYPSCKSEAAARASASKLLTNPNIQDYLNVARAERSKRTQIDADWLLKRLADEAEADLADIYDANTGALLPIHKWPKIWRQGLVAGVKTRQERNGDDEEEEFADVVEVKLADRNSIKKMIGDHIGVQAFKQQHEHKHTHEFEELTNEQLDQRIANLLRKVGVTAAS
jgi:phage terminase small subunit